MDKNPAAPIGEPKNGDGAQSNQPEPHQTADASRVSPDAQGLALRFRESIVAKLAEGGERKTAAKLDERTVNDGKNNNTDSDSLLPLYDQTRPFIFDAVKATRDLIVVASKIQSYLYPEIAQGQVCCNRMFLMHCQETNSVDVNVSHPSSGHASRAHGTIPSPGNQERAPTAL